MPNIGKYEIESRIGHGGMGDVYRAFDPTLRRRVAIKVLKVGGDTETLNRFRLEATSAGNLNHPNIVTIHDYGDFEGEPYIVMEYLEGEDLQRTIDGGKKFDLVEITDIMSQVADALECAHQAGVIHRDVKPANIMLLSRGGVKLMDFGIARLAGANTQQTKIGHLVGTVLYMSPEQFHNMELDRRVDIWAFGVIYYQLLAGKHPFQVPDQIVTMYNIANKPAPPICSVNHDVPEALGQIVDRCLAKDREQRYATMEDIRFDVMPVLQDLASQQASRMIGEARKLANEGFWEGAQTTIKRVLEMDPANREAVAFRKTIADALRRRETGPRISTLTAAAEQHVADKQFTKAIEAIDTALKIEPSSEELRKRASEVRELMEREKHAVDLLQAARQDLATEHFTGAYENATQALKYDPNRSEALQLIASVQLEIEKRDRQKRYREGLDKAREVLRSGAHGEAIRLLQELLGTFPGSLEASQLLREATVARDVHQRQKNLHDALASVQELLRAQRFPEAVQRLEALTTEFAGEDEVIQMLRYAREEWKVLQRTEALERAKTNVIQLQNEGRFDEALHLVQRSQTEFPGEAALARLEQAVTAAKAEAERRAALERVIADAETKKRAGELTAALKAVDLGLEQHGPDQRLLGVREQIEQDWRLAQRNQAYQKTLGEGRDFIARAEWDKAIAHFQQMVRQYPEEAEPKKLLASAETSLAETRKTKERELKLFEARQKAEEEQKRRAQEAEEKAREQRRQLTAKVEDTLARAYLAVSQNDLAKAAKLIAEAGTIDANHPGLPGAQRDLEAAQRLAMRPSAGKKSSPAKGIAIGAGIGVLVLGGAFFFLPKPSDNTVKPPKPIGGETIPPQPPPAKPEPVKPVAVNPEPAKPDPAKPVAIGLTPQALDIQHQVGGPNPPDRSIFIDGKGPYQASVRNGQWVTISPANGTMPGPLAVSIHPAQLPPGSYATQLVVVSGDTKKFANIHLTVTEAAKPVVVTPPPTPVTPTDEPKKPVTGGIFLGGRRLGDLVWSGTLAPGAKVVIGPGGVINGGGSVVRAPIPRDVAFDAVSQTPGVQAIAGPNSLTLTNTSGAPVQDVTVHWTVK